MQLRYFGTLLALAGLATATAHGQTLGLGTHLGPKAGLSLAVFDGLINTKGFIKPGFSGGLMLRIRPSRGFALQPEVLFSQQGSDGSNALNSKNPDFGYRLNYLSVPLLFKAYIGNVFYLQAGPQLSFLLSANRKSFNGAGGTDVRSNLTGTDFSLTGGLGADLPGGMVVSARVGYGLSDINNNDLEAAYRKQFGLGGLHNRTFEFSVGYLFGADKD